MGTRKLLEVEFPGSKLLSAFEEVLIPYLSISRSCARDLFEIETPGNVYGAIMLIRVLLTLALTSGETYREMTDVYMNKQ